MFSKTRLVRYSSSKLPITAVLFLALMTLTSNLLAEPDDSALWKKLGSGSHFAIVRHALAPGFGDPDNFTPGDCRTQRNLSDEGREQARDAGRLFRKHGIETADLYSSQWCRCKETAELFGLGEVSELPALNSFFEYPERGEMQMKALREWLTERESRKPLILVTHQVTISALTGVFPRSGEMVIVQQLPGGDFSVAGRIRTD